nr:helix-turn-helix domain-containing protein [uncultured Sellimonas sp.]
MIEFVVQKTVSAEEVKAIRQRLHLKQRELADLMNVSVKTVEHWESSKGTVKGAAAVLLGILWDRSWLAEKLEIPEKVFPLRLRYMYHDRLCTVMMWRNDSKGSK